MMLPLDHSFVVQLRPSTAGDEVGALGRVEHIDSGRSRWFRSWKELEDFMTRHCEVVGRG